MIHRRKKRSLFSFRSPFLSVSVHRRENQQKERTNPCGNHMAVRATLGYISSDWMGKIRPRAFRPVLYSGLEGHEGTQPVFCHHHLPHEPHLPSHHHHVVLLWYRSETIRHLQVYGRQQPHSQRDKDAAAAHGGECLIYSMYCYCEMKSKICTLSFHLNVI